MSNDRKPFVDFRVIRSRLKIEDVLARYGVLETLTGAGNHLSGPCPVHGGSNRTQFRVDLEKNLWNCFGDCKSGGNALDFIAKKEGMPIYDAALLACEWFSIPVPRQSNTGSEEKPEETSSADSKKEAKERASGRPDVNPPLQFRLESLDAGHPYFAERGITPATVHHFGLGYCTGKKGLMTGRVVIPIHNVNGDLVAYAGRWPGSPPNKDTPKYLLPPGFRKSLELFNFHRTIKEPDRQPLVIVEGFIDAIKLHQNGCRKVVALMGSDLSKAQEQLLRQHARPYDRVFVMMDEDEAGRAARMEIATRLSKFCFVKIYEFDHLNAQPEHLSPEQVQRIADIRQ